MSRWRPTPYSIAMIVLMLLLVVAAQRVSSNTTAFGTDMGPTDLRTVSALATIRG